MIKKTDSGNDKPLSPNPTVDYFDDLDYFKDLDNEFPTIVYNDGLTSILDLGIKPLINSECIDELNLINETSLSEYDEEIVSRFNDLFNNIHPDNLKSEKDDDDNDIVVINLNIVIWNYYVNGMLLFLIINLYVPYGIPFYPKWYYKDGSHTSIAEAKETVDKETHMAEQNNYIIATRKNFVSNDNEGRMVEKCIVEIQGTFLKKIRNDAFNRNKGENAYEHNNKFLDVVGPIKINGLTQDRFRLNIFPVSLTEAAYEWFTKECMGSITTWNNMVEKFIMKFHHLSDHNDDEDIEEEEDPNETDNAPEIFMIEGIMFDFETPLCEAFNEFNCLLKIDIDLFTYDIQDLKTYDEYEQELNNDEAKGTDEPWSEKGVPYQLCDHICEPYRFKNGKTKWPTCTSDID
ncbi:hypothetical protein Tco_0508942 [Tanacetum coccineum]